MLKSTETLVKTGRSFYAIAMAGIGFQLFFYSDFHPVIVPAWPAIPLLKFWVYLAGALLIAAAMAIILDMKGRNVSLYLGAVLLVLLCFSHIPYEFMIDPNSKRHVGVWTNALKELALSGGAFVAAGSFAANKNNSDRKNAFPRLVEKLIPAGPVFFSITMISFGVAHFLYTQPISTLVPAWIPNAIFWTYFAGVSLIASGIAVILGIKLKTTGILLGSMILIWFFILHIPRSIADPFGNKGNEITSAFTALAFSGIAFMIASRAQKKHAGLTSYRE